MSIAVGIYNSELLKLQVLCIVAGIFCGSMLFGTAIKDHSFGFSLSFGIMGFLGGMFFFGLLYENKGTPSLLDSPVAFAHDRFYHGGRLINLTPLKNHKTLIDPFYKKDKELSIQQLSEKVLNSLKAESFIGD